MKKGIVGIIVLLLLVLPLLMSSESDADIASYNLSHEADMFRIVRRIVFYNGITDTYMLVLEGRCSIEVDNMDNQLEVTVKTGQNEFKKHYLGLSDNVTYFAEQLDSAEVDTFHYKVIFKPKSIIPDFELVN